MVGNERSAVFMVGQQVHDKTIGTNPHPVDTGNRPECLLQRLRGRVIHKGIVRTARTVRHVLHQPPIPVVRRVERGDREHENAIVDPPIEVAVELLKGLFTRRNGVWIGGDLIGPFARLKPILATLCEPAICLMGGNPAVQHIQGIEIPLADGQRIHR